MARSGWRSRCGRRRGRSTSAWSWCVSSCCVDPIDAHVDVVSRSAADDRQGRAGPAAVAQRRRRSQGLRAQPDVVRGEDDPGGVRVARTGRCSARPSPFGVGNCAALPLKPKLKIALTGKGQTTDGKHPGVKASLTQRAGEANLKRVQVKLPLSLALDPDNAQALCEFEDGTKVDPTCPKGSIVGRARAMTPILDQPLTAPVYFVKNVRIDPKSGRQIRTLPMLVIPLRGENGIKLNLKGTSSVSERPAGEHVRGDPRRAGESLRPDDQGRQERHPGVSNANICRSKQVADVQIDGQNNKASDRNAALATPLQEGQEEEGQARRWVADARRDGRARVYDRPREGAGCHGGAGRRDRPASRRRAGAVAGDRRRARCRSRSSRATSSPAAASRCPARTAPRSSGSCRSRSRPTAPGRDRGGAGARAPAAAGRAARRGRRSRARVRRRRRRALRADAARRGASTRRAAPRRAGRCCRSSPAPTSTTRRTSPPTCASSSASPTATTRDGVTMHLVGQGALWAGMVDLTKDDLADAEKVGFPIVLVILLLVFGSLTAALLPLALGAAAVDDHRRADLLALDGDDHERLRDQHGVDDRHRRGGRLQPVRRRPLSRGAARRALARRGAPDRADDLGRRDRLQRADRDRRAREPVRDRHRRAALARGRRDRRGRGRGAADRDAAAGAARAARPADLARARRAAGAGGRAGPSA